jgi:CheY-like chemotaxis protein
MRLKHLLIVDDSEADQFLCRMLLEDMDPTLEIQQAYNGIEALDLLAATKQMPQLILLDINMPLMNGFEFLDALDSQYPDSTVVVSMLSSSANEEDRQMAARHARVKKYLQKPISDVSLDELNSLV